MNLFIAPHNDDEVLFACYKILREKPLVVIVTHSTLQGDNGDERALESYRAMRVLDVPVCFLQIPEDKLNEEALFEKLNPLFTYGTVYTPKIEGGNPHHDLITKVVEAVFPNVKHYPTYGKGETRSGDKEVIPTPEERELKNKAMNCYKTQIENPLTSHYFNTDKEYE
jgi:LmbE family N-acetylglucosaminyl deacetylase